jgi:hypothetical protein
MKSTPHTPTVHTRCRVYQCSICEGGLFVCLVCGLAEASLTTDCPGRHVSSQHVGEILHGRLDYAGGAWFDLDPQGKTLARERLAKVRAGIVARLRIA